MRPTARVGTYASYRAGTGKVVRLTCPTFYRLVWGKLLTSIYRTVLEFHGAYVWCFRPEHRYLRRCHPNIGVSGLGIREGVEVVGEHFKLLLRIFKGSTFDLICSKLDNFGIKSSGSPLTRPVATTRSHSTAPPPFESSFGVDSNLFAKQIWDLILFMPPFQNYNVQLS